MECSKCKADLPDKATVCTNCGTPSAATINPAVGSVVMTADSAPFVAMETSLGKIVIELYWQYAPKTCQVGQRERC